MSRPENTTTPPSLQHQMLTTAEDFHPTTVLGVKHHLFQVNAGLPVEEALNAAHSLLDAAECLSSEGISNGPHTNQTVAIRLMVQASKALVGACMDAMEKETDQ